MNHIEEKIIQTIDEHREEIIALAKDIQNLKNMKTHNLFQHPQCFVLSGG